MKCFAVALVGLVCTGSHLRKPQFEEHFSLHNTDVGIVYPQVSNSSRADLTAEKYAKLVLKGLKLAAKLSVVTLGMR